MSTSNPRSSDPSHSNPFRRNKQARILGIDNPSFVASSDDVSSIRSGFSDHSLGVRRQDSKRARMVSPNPPESDAASAIYSKHSSTSGDDGGSLATSTYNANSPDENGNPFEEELNEEEDSIDELEHSPPRIRRRRTVPSKAGVVTNAENDNPWRTSTKLGNHSSSRKVKSPDVPDSNNIPLKAQKTLGISKRGKLMTEDDFRRAHSLSPETDNIAPKALKMLGIPSNPFQKPPPKDDGRQTFGDELEQHGSKGPTSMHKRRMDVDDFKRMLLSGDREYMTPGYFHPNLHRDSSSNTDVSSLSRSSVLSSRPDSHVETPRSSHDLSSRPTLTRIATDPGDHGAPPNDLVDASPASLNKPLPPPPSYPVFELAGSSPGPQIPDPSTRRRIQQTKHAGGRRHHHPEPIAELPTMQEFSAVELPAEPVAPPVLSARLGSEAQPIELPAREATPSDMPARNFRPPPPSHIATQARSPPAVPPPRRGGSHRNTIVVPQGIPELAEKSPDPRRQPLKAQYSLEQGHAPLPNQGQDIRSFSRPPQPPARTSSNRHLASSITPPAPHEPTKHDDPPQELDGSTVADSFGDRTLQAELPSTSTTSRPPYPPRRRTSSGASGEPERPNGTEDKSRNIEPPVTPRRPAVQTGASPSRLPPLQTKISSETTGSLSDHIVSALSPLSNFRNPLSPGDTISIMSMDSGSPTGKKPSLGSIASAVAGNAKFTISGNSFLDRRPSRQETLQVLDRVVHDNTKTEKEKIDVLADLGALQREVDALRRSYEYNGREDDISEENEDGKHDYTTTPESNYGEKVATTSDQLSARARERHGADDTAATESEAEDDKGFVIATESRSGNLSGEPRSVARKGTSVAASKIAERSV